MKLTPEQRKLLISSIKNGDVQSLESRQKVKSGQKKVLSNMLEAHKFFSAIDKDRKPIDRKAQMESGEIEVEIIDPLLSDMKRFFSKPGMQAWWETKKQTNPIK